MHEAEKLNLQQMQAFLDASQGIRFRSLSNYSELVDWAYVIPSADSVRATIERRTRAVGPTSGVASACPRVPLVRWDDALAVGKLGFQSKLAKALR